MLRACFVLSLALTLGLLPARSVGQPSTNARVPTPTPERFQAVDASDDATIATMMNNRIKEEFERKNRRNKDINWEEYEYVRDNCQLCTYVGAEVTSNADLSEGGLVVSPNENNRRAQALRKLVATVPPAGKNVVLVTHKPNILDALGKDWFDVREGEASIFKPDGNGGYGLVARVQAADWSKLAQTVN